MDLKPFASTIVIICIIISCTINECRSVTKIFSVESDQICSPIVKRHIHLDELDHPAAVVTEVRYFDTWTGDKEFKCKFKVEVSGQRLSFLFPNAVETGVFAVIQNITLRRDMDGRCIDYIRFKQRTDMKSRHFCGTFAEMALDRSWDPDRLTPFAPNAFLDPSGHLDVEIFVAKQKLKPDERIDFSIVFSSYRECQIRSPNWQSCLSDSSDNDTLTHKYCISNHLFHDGYINCPFVGCVDEGGCKTYGRNRTIIDHGNGTAVTVGALAVIVLVFACFLSALWILRKLHILCWSAAATNRNSLPVVHFTEDPAPELVPTAPNPELVLEPGTPDKDPPPAYDSLFPPKPSES